MHLENHFRSRIQIGDFSVLRSFQSLCPRCHQDFNIVWSVTILSIPLHRTVDLKCPYCQHEFLIVACDLTEADGHQRKVGEAFIP